MALLKKGPSVLVIRTRLFAFRNAQPDPATGIVPERCASCVHFEPYTLYAPKGKPRREVEGEERSGRCLLIGGAVSVWTVCNKYRTGSAS